VGGTGERVPAFLDEHAIGIVVNRGHLGNGRHDGAAAHFASHPGRYEPVIRTVEYSVYRRK